MPTIELALSAINAAAVAAAIQRREGSSLGAETTLRRMQANAQSSQPSRPSGPILISSPRYWLWIQSFGFAGSDAGSYGMPQPDADGRLVLEPGEGHGVLRSRSRSDSILFGARDADRACEPRCDGVAASRAGTRRQQRAAPRPRRPRSRRPSDDGPGSPLRSRAARPLRHEHVPVQAQRHREPAGTEDSEGERRPPPAAPQNRYESPKMTATNAISSPGGLMRRNAWASARRIHGPSEHVRQLVVRVVGDEQHVTAADERLSER